MSLLTGMGDGLRRIMPTTKPVPAASNACTLNCVTGIACDVEERTLKAGVAAGLLATAALLGGCRAERAYAQALPNGPTAQQPSQQAAIPDSPKPQTLPDAASVTPGKGASGSLDATAADPDAPPTTLPSSAGAAVPAANDVTDTVAPEIIPETGAGSRIQPLRVRVNFVEVPFTVKDKRGILVPALTWRDVRVFENGVRKHLSLFTTDPYPLSVAFIVDQSMPYETMNQVNTALGAVQGAFTPYDELAIYTYNNGTRLATDYTGAQSARVGAVVEHIKSTGREHVFPGGGPLDNNININNGAQANTDPLTNTYHGAHQAGSVQNLPKEQHPLNDAIFEAAKSLSRRPDGRRRIIYVVSDGKEAGSSVKGKELVKFMQTNKISLYATVVGNSSIPYVGFLDKYHIPLTMRENVLPQYASATGGEAISEFKLRGIETSFARIAEEVRVQYTAGYYSNEPLTDGKYRTLEVQVLKPGLDVIAKKGYYPSAETQRTSSASTPQ